MKSKIPLSQTIFEPCEKVPGSELNERMRRFHKIMDNENPDWEFAAIFGRINQFYYTGTMQDGVLLIPRSLEPELWVRRSYDRACYESNFPKIFPMKSFCDAAREMRHIPSVVYLETDIVPLGLFQRFSKYFPFSSFKSLDLQSGKVRSVKSSYELSFMKQSGIIHQYVFEKLIPDMFYEGMNEAELSGELFSTLLKEGHHGVARFGGFGIEMILGQLGFGESSLYPTAFDGPGGTVGLCNAVPVLGNRKRKLKRGDLVFIDTACGVEGYHTDKTMTYMWKEELPDDAKKAHYKCVQIEKEAASMLKPGITPEEIYTTITENLNPDFLENFMGYGERRVSFLGHGIGLLIDEIPVIARGFNEPLEEGMVIALEPKKGIKGVGMVGIEDTFIVTPGGGKKITGENEGLLLVQ